MITEQLSGKASQFRHAHFDELESTNTWLVENAQSGEAGNLWITADIQTAAKGSRGRAWTSQPGNLFASLLLVDPSKPEHMSQLTFVAALAVRDAVLAVASDQDPDVALKWPNDVMLNGKKCSGILLEGGEVKSKPFVVIGIGVNCQSSPEETLHPATSLAACGITTSSRAFFFRLAEQFSIRLDEWNRGEGFSVTRNAWLEHAFGLGEPVSVVVPGKEKESGSFASIDDKGYMVLQRADGSRKRLSTADIFFGSAMSQR